MRVQQCVAIFRCYLEVYGVSRMGSGSHLMAFVDARARGWNPEELRLKVPRPAALGNFSHFLSERSERRKWKKRAERLL